jgi:hypothetical protein
VAHTDTVQRADREKQFKVVNGTIRGYLGNKRAGIGADDKNGIYIALEVLKYTSDPIKLLFTHSEEIGCIGASEVKAIDMADVAYMLEFDRRGSGDIINYGSDEFLKIVQDCGKQYGYKETDGLFTDVTTLSKNFGISAVNLSCGYYDAHTNKEFTVWSELDNSANFAVELILNIPVQVFKYKYVSPYKSYKYDTYELDWHNFGKQKKLHQFPADKFTDYGYCDYCGAWCTDLVQDDQYVICHDCKASEDAYFKAYNGMDDNEIDESEIPF